MSTEWFVQAYVNGQDQPVDVASILLEIRKERTKVRRDSIDVFLEEGHFSTFFIDTAASVVSSLMIARPLQSVRLNELLFRILKLGNFILFAPDGAFPIARVADIAVHLPPGMMRAIGVPRIAHTRVELEGLLSRMHSERRDPSDG